MTTKNLLVELFVEELPPKALMMLGESFSSLLLDGLVERDLASKDSISTAFASPRRLATHITYVSAVAPDSERFEKLIPISIGLDASGKPTEVLKKRLGKIGRGHLADLWPTAVIGPDGLKGVQDGPDRLFIKNDGKADAFYLRMMSAGSKLLVGLMSSLEEVLSKLPIPKIMTYQLADGWSSVNFVRPAHGLVALHGSDVVNVSVLGLNAGRTTQGHRFEASKPVIELKDADSYAQQLETEGAVIASFAARRAEIVKQLQAAANKEGLQPITDEALLDEVTALVERPNVLTCQFEKEFLEVPAECLILTMKANQKYFPLLDTSGKLTNKFLVVSNIRPADPSRVIQGNERVVRPRLADAKFFFDEDRKQTLESRLPKLDKVVYHNKLGTQGDRVKRVQAIARGIGFELGGEQLARQADRAALLAKADLVTDMVSEFPELQGVMGGYYARHDNENELVALAIEDHYKPKFSGDSLPRNTAGVTLALADKLETLIGLFGIGQLPTGDKDPFALRRHALGVIRMLEESVPTFDLPKLLEISLNEWISAAATQPVNSLAGVEEKLPAFFYDRLDVMLRERGFTAHEVEAVLCLHPRNLRDITTRLNSLRIFTSLPEGASLAAANKRINNILKKNDGAQAGTVVNDALLNEAAERELFKQLQAAEADTAPLFASHNYQDALTRLAQLRAAVDAFFDGVMVMAEDVAVRNNRLALLSRLRNVFLQVADLSRLPG